MKIDYMRNPLAIVKRFVIPYGNKSEGLKLEGRVIAHTEEGLDGVNWFSGEVVYANKRRGRIEIGGLDEAYKELKRGGPTIKDVEEKLELWCNTMGLKVCKQKRERAGVSGYRFNQSFL